MKLGIYGGSFDPVHLGHLLVARAAIEELGLQKLFFVPAASSPFKPESQPAPDELRLRLLRLALAGMKDCEVDRQEIDRGGTSYTIETLRHFARSFPGAELFFCPVAGSRGTRPPGGLCGRAASRRGRGCVPPDVPGPDPEGLSHPCFFLGDPGPAESGPAHRSAGPGAGGRGHPGRKNVPVVSQSATRLEKNSSAFRAVRG